MFPGTLITKIKKFPPKTVIYRTLNWCDTAENGYLIDGNIAIVIVNGMFVKPYDDESKVDRASLIIAGTCIGWVFTNQIKSIDQL